MEQAEEAVEHIIHELMAQGVTTDELAKTKNRAITTLEFEKVEVMNRAMNLAFAALSGEVGSVNQEREKIARVSAEDMQLAAAEILRPENSSTLYYLAEGI